MITLLWLSIVCTSFKIVLLLSHFYTKRMSGMIKWRPEESHRKDVPIITVEIKKEKKIEKPQMHC